MRLPYLAAIFLTLAPGLLQAQTAPPSDAHLGFALLKRVSAEHPDGNIIIAPRNIRTALAAVATGAEGETRQQIVAITGDYASIDHTPLASAKSAMDIWVAPVEKLLPSFAAGLSGVHVQSTSAEDAPAAINGFVSEHTNGMIRNVVDHVENSGIVLTAVLYFKGMWQFPFDKKDTKPRPFHFSTGNTANVDTMFKEASFDYAENDSGQVIQLPYRDDNLVLTVFLPKRQIDIKTWLASIDDASWKATLSQLHWKPGDLQLPKLKSSFSTMLSKNLQALGMRRPFDDSAQFHGIVEGHALKIDEVIHKTAFDMDEVSTEASAATSVHMVATAIRLGPPPTPFSMIVDRPFFLTVGDRSNDRILFMGVVNAP
jgi:serine protease inhibitor